MPRSLILDSFPLSCMGRVRDEPTLLTDQCQDWVLNCLASGHQIYVPAIVYYETLRELERRNARGQIARLQRFCFSPPIRFIELETAHLELAAKLWARSRNQGTPTSSRESLDADVILAAQTLSLNLPLDGYVLATTNIGHLMQFVNAELWTNITPGS